MTITKMRWVIRDSQYEHDRSMHLNYVSTTTPRVSGGVFADLLADALAGRVPETVLVEPYCNHDSVAVTDF